MSSKKLQEFVINSFDGGLNTRDVISDLSDNELSECLNMYYQGKALKTRKGAAVKSKISLSQTDCTVVPISTGSYVDGLGYKMFLVTNKDDTSCSVRILVVKSDSSYSFLDLKTINFSDYSNGFARINCLSFSGKETVDGGCYLLLGVFDNKNILCDKYIYELNLKFNKISQLGSKDIYKPLVSIHGKGNNYSQLQSSKRTFPTSRRFEDFNMLSGGFRAGFTTDGLSTTFYLPANNLSNNSGENIVIDYTDNTGANYLIEIPYNSSTSYPTKIGEVEFTFTIDRVNGKIVTFNVLGTEMALPMSDSIRNNLVITAYKANDKDDFFRMTVAENFNSRVFVTGNKMKNNVVRFSREDNPLYFPESNFAYFGERSSNIVALKQNNDRLLVFKAHQIGVCSAISGSSLTPDHIFGGGTITKAITEKITIKTLKTGIGCLYPETIMSCSNRLVFLGSDNRVYAITSSSNYTHRFYRISDKIENKLNEKEFSNAFCADDDGYYMLFVDNRCFLFDYNSSHFLSASSANGNKKAFDKIAWFYFEYDFGIANALLSLNFQGKALIVAKASSTHSPEKVLLYALEGSIDQNMGNTMTLSNVSIKSKFTTGANRLLKDGRKNIVAVELVLLKDKTNTKKAAKLAYLNENHKQVVSEISAAELEGTENIIRKTPCIFGIRHFGVGLERAGYFAIRQIKYIYKS